MINAKQIFGSCLKFSAIIYRRLPIKTVTRQKINNILLRKIYFITRHILRAIDPPEDTSLELKKSLSNLFETQKKGIKSPPIFPTQDQPDVSIIIPVFNNYEYTALCLESIAQSKTKRSFEIIIVNDASTDNTFTMLKKISGVHVINKKINSGFINSCNEGASNTKGRLLLFLNNDTWVVPGWLDALADTIDNVENAGLVGSKLVYPDGRLQEAGGIIWNDASGWNFGRLQDPSRPDLNYLRDVDYCSGASIMISKSLFEKINGFDLRYSPAYFEDTDLAFSVRKIGLRVLFQPTSEVIHFEGITSGRDIKKGVKSFQEKNLHKFKDKWSESLSDHRPPGEMPELEKERSIERRALIIDTRTPMTDRDSGSIDLFNYFKLLIKLGFKTSFIAAEHQFYAGRYTKELQKIGVECLYDPYISSVKSHLSKKGPIYDLVILSRAHNAHRHIDDVRKYCPNARIVFNTVDLHYLREQRRAVIEKSTNILEGSKVTKEIELSTMRKADATIVISQTESAILENEAPEIKIFTIPLLREIPGRSGKFKSRRDVIFIGGYDHPPNIDAVIYFTKKIWPIIKSRIPDAFFKIIGSNAPEEIKNISEAGVEFIGQVDDLAPYFNQCRLSVAPLRYGAGTKGKIATSLGFGLPCITTPIAAEGMGLTDRENIIIADNEIDFANAVIDLYCNEYIWQKISDNGLEYAEKKFSLENNLVPLKEALASIQALPSRRHNALAERRLIKKNTKAYLQITLVDNFHEYQAKNFTMVSEKNRRQTLEKRLTGGKKYFSLRGYCHICGAPRNFLVDFKYTTAGATQPNWRERLTCSRCNLNNRVRASLHVYEQIFRPTLEDAIYVTEQCTPLFNWINQNYPNVTGSEYLGNSIPAGTFNNKGIRNESICKLTFADSSFDYILSFDVLEHIPDYLTALSECLRCLKTGGSLIISIPFRQDQVEHLKRARLLEDGTIEHILPAEYHGDPLNKEGCLCYYHFGWSILDEMRSLGFSKASACLYWSEEYCYLGGENILFIGLK